MRFSVIMSLHNSAKFVKKALNSVKSQTFDDYELICVCDSCTDDSAKIARKYTDKVLEVNNQRMGPTLNAGLDIAQGEYIMFMDDDDWWLHEFVLEMIDKALKTSETPVDVLFFSFLWKGIGYAHYRSNGGDNYYPAVWNKCWKRSFIGDHRFTDKQYGSDLVFHNEMMPLVKRYAEWDQPFYYYNYLRKGSLTKQLHDGEIEE